MIKINWLLVTDWLLNNLPTIILSSVALIISVRSWYKTRIFYDLDIYPIAGSAGGTPNTIGQLKIIREKLNTGKYTILDTFEETGDGRNRVSIIIGKVKK